MAGKFSLLLLFYSQTVFDQWYVFSFFKKKIIAEECRGLYQWHHSINCKYLIFILVQVPVNTWMLLAWVVVQIFSQCTVISLPWKLFVFLFPHKYYSRIPEYIHMSKLYLALFNNNKGTCSPLGNLHFPPSFLPCPLMKDLGA